MINTPQNPITLPAEVKAEVEKVKKQMAISEQELITIQKTRVAEEYAVRELLKKKTELQANKSKLENAINTNSEKLAKITKDNTKLRNQNIELEKKNRILSKKIDKKRKELSGKELELEGREEKLKTEELKLTQERKDVDEARNNVVNYIEKLKEVISKFNL